MGIQTSPPLWPMSPMATVDVPLLALGGGVGPWADIPSTWGAAHWPPLATWDGDCCPSCMPSKHTGEIIEGLLAHTCDGAVLFGLVRRGLAYPCACCPCHRGPQHHQPLPPGRHGAHRVLLLAGGQAGVGHAPSQVGELASLGFIDQIYKVHKPAKGCA